MNIFYVDSNPIAAAMSLGDKHVVKMILETAQILSTAHRVLDGSAYFAQGKKRRVTRYILPDDRDWQLYAATHVNHPSTIWARSSSTNYVWLYLHFIGLNDEYTRRYQKTHKCLSMRALAGTPKHISNMGFTEPPCAMPDDYVVPGSAIASYRNYYNGAKKHLHSWKNSKAPDWIIQDI